jgi:hypothetical protein
MGRARTFKTEDTIMVQVREFAEGGGIQSTRCFPCLDTIDGGGGVGEGWGKGEGSCHP